MTARMALATPVHAARRSLCLENRRTIAKSRLSAKSACSGGWPFLSPSRRMSTAETTPGSLSSAFERASSNAATFDARNRLDGPSAEGWRLRTHGEGARAAGLRTTATPHDVSPQKRIAPSSYPPPFFPGYAHTGRIGPPALAPNTILIHDEDSARGMRNAGKLARRLLDYACGLAAPGVTTDAIDALVHDAALAAGAYPSPLNYHGFPKSLCSSVGEVVCHGIPDARALERGDIVSFDVSCFLEGVHGDNCATVIVGDTDDDGGRNDPSDAESEATTGGETDSDWRGIPCRTQFRSPEEEESFVTARRLVRAALEGRDEGVRACRPGACLTEIGAAIHGVADAYGYDTVRQYRGHGIGSDFHSAPFVKHYRNECELELVPGMIFTVEPMFTEGSAECSEWSDGWTVVTHDGGRAAQFEHTVLITETGVEILTSP